MLKSIDLEAFLDKSFFAIDTLSMLSDIEDFIDFSERNIDWQKNREIRHAEIAFTNEHFDNSHEDAQFHEQTIDGLRYRFGVSLTQRVRYAALVSLITTIEWVLFHLKNRSNINIPKKANGTSDAVHLLIQFNQAASLGLSSKIQEIEILVQVRNCIVHAAGLLASYKHGSDLRQSLSTYNGIRISDINLLGDAIEIEQNHLQLVVEEAKNWLPNLENAIQAKGLLRR